MRLKQRSSINRYREITVQIELFNPMYRKSQELNSEHEENQLLLKVRSEIEELPLLPPTRRWMIPLSSIIVPALGRSSRRLIPWRNSLIVQQRLSISRLGFTAPLTVFCKTSRVFTVHWSACVPRIPSSSIPVAVPFASFVVPGSIVRVSRMPYRSREVRTFKGITAIALITGWLTLVRTVVGAFVGTLVATVFLRWMGRVGPVPRSLGTANIGVPAVIKVGLVVGFNRWNRWASVIG
ncbi:hypothetical protein L596_007193 [Steinernema carpocapsae]|uniref:Uncharacterized protein n=1 Tax=Steinernema carpocapsae TaxID=34508 RepID=A0A4V6XWJ6_STECR|nr:hypothetical protein L596_007193 [Steinernema carpocapsae]